MKKILFLFLMVIGLMSSLYALDTGQSVGCDGDKSQTINIDVTTTSISDKALAVYAVAQPPTYTWSQVDKDLDDMIKQCAINSQLKRGHSKYMGESGV